MVKVIKKLKLSRKKESPLERKLKDARTLADIERILKRYGTHNI